MGGFVSGAESTAVKPKFEHNLKTRIALLAWVLLAIGVVGYAGYVLYVDGATVAWLLGNAAYSKFLQLDITTQYFTLVGIAMASFIAARRALRPSRSSEREYSRSNPDGVVGDE